MPASKRIAKVDWQPPRRDEDYVEADVEALVTGMAGEPKIGGTAHPAARVRGDRRLAQVPRRALLHLDEGDALAPPGDDVYFANWRLEPPGQDDVSPSD